MTEITLKAPKEVIKVNFGEKTFSVPLGGSLPAERMISISKATGNERLQLMMNLFVEYIPEDIMEQLTMGEMSQLINAWSEETKKASGISVGES